MEDDKDVGSEFYLLVVHVDEANRLVHQLVALCDIPIPDVKDDHQIVHEKVRRGGVSLNDKQIPPVELTTCDPPVNK